MKQIAVFYHAMFYGGTPPKVLPNALSVVAEQMGIMRDSGLENTASEIIVGINGGDESRMLAGSLLPVKSRVTYHGLQCRNECRTLRLLEEWLPGHEDWYVLYHHSKGATHHGWDVRSARWRECMEKHTVAFWRRCVEALDNGFEAAGCHWFMPPRTPPGQHIFAGNFWWAKASFLATLPSIMQRDRIRVSGMDSIESRYEAEVWLGNGPRVPHVKDFHPNWLVDARPHP